jgi:hypothetical protein
VDERIDVALHELAAHLEFPASPDLTARVIGELQAPARRQWSWRPPWQRALVLGVTATLLLAATVAAFAFVLPGLRITTVPALPSAEVPRDPLAVRLALGSPVETDTVRAGVPSLLGPPDEAYVLGDHEVLSLVYASGEDLPELGESGIGLLVQVIDGVLDRERVEKLVGELGVSLTPVEIGDGSGYWISGPPHLIHYTSPSGVDRSEATRLVGDALVWERRGVLYRIESGLGRSETLRIAESIAP